MPREDCTLTQEFVMGRSLHMVEKIARPLIPGLVFIAAVTGVLAVPLKALWECIHHAAILQVSSRFGSRLPPGRSARL